MPRPHRRIVIPKLSPPIFVMWMGVSRASANPPKIPFLAKDAAPELTLNARKDASICDWDAY